MGLFSKDKKDSGSAVADPVDDALPRLRHKYDAVIRRAHDLGVAIRNVEMQGGKLLIRGEAPSDEAKNKVWDEIKRVDPGYADLTVDLRVVGGSGSAGQGGPTGVPTGGAVPPASTYTVKSGDTLSKISKQFYGDASEYKKIFEANRDKLSNPDEIKPGQELRIPQ